ncbi:hypothetical protein A9K55_008392 [Cordyceps militaris]|uniref:Uncharacterized protein n=1 Tax=Cordyceps militaris TaxID=73501 RepID=A0A2H4SG88_CORMI|nr:hypothetical protein A9K55_008392 [Cordyceps militaris]
MHLTADHAASSATSSPRSIIDREREHKAIPGSFSYNLGRRRGPPPPLLDQSTVLSPSRSVRSIVAWIESSSSVVVAPTRPAASDESGAAMRFKALSPCQRRGGSSSSSSLVLSPSPTSASLRPHFHVDDDCTTFLDYQQYFATESLARCLDEQSSVETVVSGADTTEGRVDMMREGAVRGGLRRVAGKDERFASDGAAADKRSPADVAAL